MPDSLEIKLETLTPIWTGGLEGKADQLHMTGILGSLRWWYEVLVRSVGGNACDPGKHTCIYEPNKKPHNGLCDVCMIFGTTGWARRFKLVVTEDTLQQKQPTASVPDGSGGLVFNLSSDHPSARTQGHKWYLKSNPLKGQLKLKIISTAPITTAKTGNTYLDPKVVGSLIQFIADNAGIGAKPQMGLGVVRIVPSQSIQPLIDNLKQIVARHEKSGDLKTAVNEDLPCLQNMFFARVNVRSATASDTFDLKYDLRGMFREVYKGKDDLRHIIMGYVRGQNRVGAKIMMSYPYENGTIRMWGWIPSMAHPKIPRSEILNEMYYFLEDTYGKEHVPFWLDYDPEKNISVVAYLEKFFVKGAS
ncbi:MAG: type III-B CRISPR module RAMP protein Cmr1 [Ktedonobacteraceae bacterium]